MYKITGACCTIVLLISFLPSLMGQNKKVAVVLSGGGAKGLAHIGILKVLEEHGIPIDYIAGTSMGGVIGGFYAAGYSPKQIEEIALSKEFQDWINGRIPPPYQYFFPKSAPTPSILSLELKVKSGLQAQLSTYLAKDLSLNLTLAEKLIQSSRMANNNFDSLFIPFRTTASEIFTQELLELDSGYLDRAIRATMSVPLFYRPIKIDNRYVFDGGIYNNFPTDIVQNDFQPDVIIGVNVSDKNFNEYPYENDDELLSQALFFSIVSKSDTSLGPNDVYLQPRISRFNALDFTKVQAIIDSGYAEAYAHLNEIKSKINRRVDTSYLIEKRNNYWADTLPLRFGQVKVLGPNLFQESYIRKFLTRKQGIQSMEEIKTHYYKLTSEAYFEQMIPQILYQDGDSTFTFQVKLKPEKVLDFNVGVLAASRGIGFLYGSAELIHLGNQLTKFTLNGYAGGFYQSFSLRSKTIFANSPQIYLEPVFVYNYWDYLDTEDFLVSGDSPVILERTDRKLGLNFGVALGNLRKLRLEAAYVRNTDRFSNLDIINPNDDLDKLTYSGFKGTFEVSRNNLNKKQYSNQGSRYQFSVNFHSGKENYSPGTTSLIESKQESIHTWWKISSETERYIPLSRLWTLGYQIEGVASNLPEFSNFQSTLLYAPEINPFPETQTLFLHNFRAASYAAAGFKTIYHFGNSLDYRLEGYLVNTIGRITRVSGQPQTPEITYNWWDPHIAATTGLVFHTPFGPIGLRANYYTSSQNNFQILFHAGFIIFNPRSMD